MIKEALKPLSYLIPLFVVMMTLRKRDRYPIRLLASIVLFSLCFEGLLTVQPSISASWDSPANLIVILIIYLLVMLLMAVEVLFCCNVSFASAFFYAAAAYTVQNLSFTLRVFFGGSVISPSDVSPMTDNLNLLVSVATIALSAALFYLLFVRKLGKESIEIVNDTSALVAISAALIFNIAFSAASNSLMEYGIRPVQLFIFQASQMGICVLILYMEYELLLNKRLQLEAAATEQLIRDRERQFESSRETIDAINLKCHDIRHQIRRIGDTPVVDRAMLDEITRKVDVYDTQVDTGNDALNTILTEKSLLCESLGIEFTCSADGSRLSFLSPAELYSLFGNMLDNAIEATRRLEDSAKKVITLGVRFNAGLVTIHEENYYSGKIELSDRIPQSTKNDPLNHGYGFRSMRAIVEGHDGVIDCKTADGVFCLDIAIPVP